MCKVYATYSTPALVLDVRVYLHMRVKRLSPTGDEADPPDIFLSSD